MCAAVLPGALGRRPRGLRALGPAGRDHRPGHRRRRHRDRRGRARRGRPAGAGRPRDRPDPGRRADQRRDRPPAGRGAARPTAAARPAPGAPAIGRATACPSAAWTRAPSCSPCSGRPNLASRHAVFHQYDSTVGADTVAGPGRGAAVLRVKGTTKALVATTDGNQAVGALDPWLGAALSVAEATRNVSITGARPLGVTNCLNYGDPTRPEAFWQLTEGVRGLGDACRALGLPVTGGNVSLYNESPAGRDRPDRRDRRRRPARRRRDARRPGVRGRRTTRSLLVGEPVPGLAGSAYAALAGGAAEDDPPMLDLAREAALQALHPRGDRARARRLRAGRVGRRPGRRARRVRDVGRPRGAASASPVAHSPAVDLFGEGPSRLVVTCRPRYAAALDAARPPARPAGRDARHGRRRPARRSSSAAGRRDRRRRGARQPGRRRARGPARATCATPGTTGSPAPSAGRADRCAACSGSVLPGRRADRGRVDRRARPVRAPAPRPGIGRPGGQRRRAADALQGPRA